MFLSASVALCETWVTRIYMFYTFYTAKTLPRITASK